MYNVFVYGSLKNRYQNHNIIEDASFISNAISEDNYLMYDLGSFPGVVQNKNGYKIKGEIYKVNDETFDMLDLLEGHPTHYRREKRNFIVSDDYIIEAYIYLYQYNVNEKHMLTNGDW